MPTALITGITGQDGSYLAELLLAKGYDVVGITRRSSTTHHERIAHILDRVTLASADLLDQASLTDVIEEHRPDEVYNLAAPSFVQASWGQPVLTGDLTALGVTRILESMKKAAPRARFYQASTSEMFGRAVETPQRETTPFYPRSPYGVAKVYAHWITVNYRETFDMFAVSGILFTHESPRRGIQFLSRKVTDAVARIKLGRATEVRLGDLDARRDWGFAGDYAEAMWMMLQHSTPLDFVIGTGHTRSVRELCDLAFGHVGLDYRDYVVQDPRFVRPAEPNQLVSDPSRANTELGWSPKVSFKDLITMMVDADLERVQAEAPGGR